nr:hypothetical protein [Chroococcidiopsis sp. [FACHB-1243]]
MNQLGNISNAEKTGYRQILTIDSDFLFYRICDRDTFDPDERSLLVYPLGQQPQLLQELTQVLPVPDLVANLQLTLDELFGWLKL